MNGEVEKQKAYGSIELLSLNEKDYIATRRVLMVNGFHNEQEISNFVNQNLINDLVDISFNPHIVNQIGSFPYKLFYWVYVPIRAPQLGKEIE